MNCCCGTSTSCRKSVSLTARGGGVPGLNSGNPTVEVLDKVDTGRPALLANGQLQPGPPIALQTVREKTHRLCPWRKMYSSHVPGVPSARAFSDLPARSTRASHEG